MAHFSCLIRAVLICVTLAGIFNSPVTSQTSTAAHPNPRPVLLLTGDSLTELGTYPNAQGWVALLQARYTRSADVIVRGLSGYNTRWFLKNVMPLLEDEIDSGAYRSPSLITVWLGTNDAALTNGSNSEMHVPIEDYKEYLIKVIGGFQSAAPNSSILIITPTHIGDDARAKRAAERTDVKRGRVDRSNAATGNYSRACVEVVRSRPVDWEQFD
ncbi:GDSL-like Lipase/Acylhydrolase family [Phytophthora infestans]|uniref:GDSL-like Lipase/Acylhydrolase family n=1 Tax=Phytophthora infestans TaxID=4787 RepID=A0A833W719_PHYIN|nr:GDSL-like Lipase/Acylhydrolase family [Phytophthora infestans]